MTNSEINPKVGLFATCLVDLFRPKVGYAAIKLLEDAGYSVEVPAMQTCCGQPAYNNGDENHSREIATQVIEAFEYYRYVIVPSGSCAGMIHQYPQLFHGDSRWLLRAENLVSRVHELLSFLTDVAGVELSGARYEGLATYHDSCSSLRELGVSSQPRKLLAEVEGLALTEMQDSNVCCGFGGTFCVKYPEISGRMVSDKVRNVTQSGASLVLGGDLGCLLNIAGRISREHRNIKVCHTAEVLANMADGPGIGQGSHSDISAEKV